MRTERHHWLLLLSVLGACTPTTPGPGPLTRVTPDSHPWFPVAASLDGGHSIGRGTPLDGPFTCESCHPATAPSFSDFTCTECHTHADPINALIHRGAISPAAQALALTPKGCITCHPKGEDVPYAHTTIVPGECATCHAEATAFAALPKEGLVHRDTGGADCGACHVTSAWSEVSGAPNGVFDEARNVTVTPLRPRFSGTTIVSVTPTPQVLQMTMRHNTTTLDAGLLGACVNCHSEAAGNAYYPGSLHSSLAELGVAQPTRCADCHERDAVRDVGTRPIGFVGRIATNPARDPASGEMRHEATLWVDGGPGGAALVGDCSTCHLPPGTLTADWSTGRSDAGIQFHASITAASLPQPQACLDCHANSRPKSLLTSMNATVPAGLTFDHQGADTLGECAACHTSTSVWSGARFHPVGSANPSTCLPCHTQERPTSTATWMQPGYQSAPFDYTTNDAGVRHGAGEDCVVCHSGPGSGAWGSTQNWQRGNFMHGPNTLSASGCLTCHTTQRPDLLPNPGAIATAIGFDHRLNGTGECSACHQATVVANRYARYFNPATMTLPGGDWQGGTSYPGDFLITSPGQFLTLATIRLTRATPTSLITGTTTQSVTLPNAMKHTSMGIPAQVHPGTAAAPVNTTCWHCHTNNNGMVTAYSNGVFHSALRNYSAMPGGPVSTLPLPPSTNCRDCHAQMLPPNIVQRAGNTLLPMDHRARFTSTVNIGGSMVSSVDAIDCSVCHSASGVAWTDGRFHSNIGSATPQDCASCHYPLMASTAADVTNTNRFEMRHRSGTVTTQACQTCHTMSLSRAAMMPTTASLWNPGQLHSVASTQPALCLDCHSNSEPATATQGTVAYTFTQGGGSTTNTAQWMSHTSTAVVGRDCSVCHAADAKQMGSAWNKATALHSHAPSLTQCSVCHGTGNGRGAVLGTNNNLPNGPTNSATVTTSSASPGVRAQMNHADLNATAHDCNFCHTQQGPSTVAGVQGREWAQARFHTRFTAAAPLVMNGTTARCSNCHINEKPGAAFTAFNHAAYSAATTTPDCGTCHTYPGEVTPPTPNWRGAAGMPAFISVGGFTIPNPPATTAGTVQQGIANLPHPPVATGVACTTCHTQAAGGRRAFGYPHASTTLINNNCNSCHEAGSDLVGTAWNAATTFSAGAGDTRPFTLTSVVPTFKGNSRSCAYPKHFFPIDCKECHKIPSGNGLVTTGAGYVAAWKMQHTTSKMTRPGTCNTCHAGVCNLPD